ncbi:MAG: hypothetical protein WBD84_07600, partial [Methyloceanibacter sp.]
MESPGKTTTAVIAAMTALALGLGAGYLIWGWPTNWYARNIEKLPAGDDGDLIRYGHSLIVDTASHIGKTAPDPQKRLAGNDLACVSCHLNAGLQPFAAPFVSTFATFPMLVDDQVLTLKNRINGCMLRSMNGKALPDDGREMDALIAYMGTSNNTRWPAPRKSDSVIPHDEAGGDGSWGRWGSTISTSGS